MLIALNQDNEHVHAAKIKIVKQLPKHDLYSCPGCKAPVFLKKGKIKQAHFSHYAQSNCQMFSEGETEEHVLGKQLLYNWFIQQGYPCQLEAYLPELKQRPDLLIWLNEKRAVAVEFQCSSLSHERMVERTEGYLKNNYEVYWVLGSQFKLTRSISAFQRMFMYKFKKSGYCMFFLDVYREQLNICTDIQQNQLGSAVAFKEILVKLASSNLTALTDIVTQTTCQNRQFKKMKNKIIAKELLASHHFLNRSRMYQETEMVLFQKYIYQRGHSLVSLPQEVYFPVENKLIIKTLPHFWKFILLEWITKKSLGTVITRLEITSQLKQMIKDKHLTFYSTPMIPLTEKRKAIDPFIHLLVQCNILAEVLPNQWLILSEPHFYLSEQEKLTDFSCFIK